jgi:hypothetical protein
MVSKWIIKAIVQKAISYLPMSGRINYFFQKHVTGGVCLTDEHFGLKLQHARDHLQNMKTYGSYHENNAILELGTGWYPVVPVLFFLTSAGKVTSIDIQRWMTNKTQQLTLLKFKEWRDRGLLSDLLQEMDQERWNLLMDAALNPCRYDREGINNLIGLTPLVQDARNLDLDSGSIDFICSNNTLEHIPETILRNILHEFRRLLKPSGTMSHFIDMSDHFAHFDSRITIYNFLKYSRKRWNLIDNKIQPQNRLRFRDYKELYREAGLPVTGEILRPGNPEEVARIRIHPEFSGYTPVELAISHAYVITS